MQKFYIEFSIFLSLFLAYFAINKYKILSDNQGLQGLNSSRIIVLATAFVLLQISASFATLLQFMLAQNYIALHWWQNISIYPLAYLLFIITIYLIIQLLVYGLQKKFTLPLQGWFKHIFIFISAAYFGCFLLVYKISDAFYFWQMLGIITLIIAVLLVVLYNFVYIRKTFLKNNIEASYILTFTISILFIALIV